MSYEPTDEEIYRRYHSRSEFSIRNWWPSSSEEDGDEEEVDGRSCAADSITLPDEEVEADTSRTNTHDPFMNRQAAIIRTTDPCQPLSKTVVPTLPKSARKEIAKEKKRQKNKSQKLPPSVAKTPQQIVHNHWSTLGKQNGRNENCCKCLLDAVLVGDDGNEVSKSSSVNSNNFVREGILYDIISGVRNYVKDNVGEISDEYYIEFIRTVLQGSNI